VTIIAARTQADVEAVRDLFRAYAASLPFSLDYQDFAAELAGLPGPYAAPGGCLLLAGGADAAIGVVALRRFGEGIGEIKRLYVVPQARGLGLGRKLLSRAIDEARIRSYRCVRLDSHRASMGAAIALYRQLGFAETAPFGPDLGGRIAFFEKRLQE